MPRQDSNPRPVNRKSDALPIAPHITFFLTPLLELLKNYENGAQGEIYPLLFDACNQVSYITMWNLFIYVFIYFLKHPMSEILKNTLIAKLIWLVEAATVTLALGGKHPRAATVLIDRLKADRLVKQQTRVGCSIHSPLCMQKSPLWHSYTDTYTVCTQMPSSGRDWKFEEIREI